MLVSIVVLAFNEAEIIEQTLTNIGFALHKQQDKTISWEIIVCDNNSTDQTAALAAEAGATVVVESITRLVKCEIRGQAK